MLEFAAMSGDRYTITVLGLGPGDPRLLTVAAAETLAVADRVWMRTESHPSRAAIPKTCTVSPFDDLYRTHDTFDEVYGAIADHLIREARERHVVYAVPGDPAVGETAVRILMDRADQAGCTIRIVHGISFIGPTLAALGWDALDGLQIADATALASRHHPDIDPERPTLIAQVYSQLVASEIKLNLLARFPDGHPVILVSGAGELGVSGISSGTQAARKTTLPLRDLDRDGEFDDVTTLAVPALPAGSSMLGLAEVVARLRAPDGCPWDQEQTHESLRPYLIEEAYEVLDALDGEDPNALAEELGDLLLQIALHAQIAAEYSEFTLTDVIRGIHDKLVRRHPHVFGDAHAETADDVRERWAEIKAEEKAGEQGNVPADPMAGVPKTLPSLARAQALQRRAPSGSFVADGQVAAGDVVTSVEVLGTVVNKDPNEDPSQSRTDTTERLGEALWGIATMAGIHGLDAETVLRDACTRFEQTVRSDAQEAGGIE